MKDTEQHKAGFIENVQEADSAFKENPGYKEMWIGSHSSPEAPFGSCVVLGEEPYKEVLIGGASSTEDPLGQPSTRTVDEVLKSIKEKNDRLWNVAGPGAPAPQAAPMPPEQAARFMGQLTKKLRAENAYLKERVTHALLTEAERRMRRMKAMYVAIEDFQKAISSAPEGEGDDLKAGIDDRLALIDADLQITAAIKGVCGG